MHYYKFRSLQNLRFFLDIIVNERLYAAKYDELNDPMEGAYMIDVQHQNIIKALKNKKENIRICSLSQNYTHTLLWSHYADGHKGCCIEVSGRNQREVPTLIQYTDDLPYFRNYVSPKELLSHKSRLWIYEDEVRFFRKTQYFNVNIHQIIFGQKVSAEDFKFYGTLIHSINPNIIVRKIKQEEINDGYQHNN